MDCERCGESAATLRDEVYMCGRCALKLDWVGVARAVQGIAVREAVAAAPVPAAAPAAPDTAMPPADPFAG